MTNRDLLKEAIADAKAVKEVAITNAKAALEEAFTPHLKEMFEKKMKDLEEEKDLQEYAETQPDRDMDGDGDVDAADVKTMEESELEELLRELDEAEEEESEEEEGEEGEEEEEEEVEIDLEEMTEEDLKKFIEEVVDEMIEAGELEAGHEGMEDEVGAMEEPEEGAEEAPAEEEMPVAESVLNEASDAIEIAKLIGVSLPVAKAIIMATGLSGAALITKLGSMLGKKAEKGDTTSENYKEEDEKMAAMEAELAEAIETINTLKVELNEINLLNSKLLYTNKIFKAKNLTETQKVKVLTAFDKAESVKEVKLVFETLNEGLEKAAKKELVRESKGFASKSIGSSPKQPVVDVNPVFERMRKLAGL